jgi:hypothetical protein
MRTILITLILVGIMEGLSGSVIISDFDKEIARVEKPRTAAKLTEPRFTKLDGSLFLAVQTGDSLVLDEGAVVEFQFKRKNLKSFHVNDANQNVLNHGDADILVMIHQDLALALKNEKLVELRIIDGDKISSFKVDEFWQPHTYLTSL